MNNFSDAIITRQSFKLLLQIISIDQPLRLIVGNKLVQYTVGKTIETNLLPVYEPFKFLIDCDDTSLIQTIKINSLEIYPILQTNDIRKYHNRLLFDISKPFYSWYHMQRNNGWILYDTDTYF